MSFVSPILIHLVTSFTLSTLRMSIDPESTTIVQSKPQSLFLLSNPNNRNISFTLQNGLVIANAMTTPIARLSLGDSFNFTIRCEHGFSFRMYIESGRKIRMEKATASPAFCDGNEIQENVLQIGADDRTNGNDLFYGCIRNVTLGPILLLDEWCRYRNGTYANSNRSALSSPSVLVTRSLRLVGKRHPPIPSHQRTHQQLFVLGEPIRVPEAGTTPLQWKHIRLGKDYQNDDGGSIAEWGKHIVFEVVNPPEHGQLQSIAGGDQSRLSTQTPWLQIDRFTYTDLLVQSIAYRHDGSESVDDSFDLEVRINEGNVPAKIVERLRDTPSVVLSLRVRIEPRNDPPQLSVGPKGPIVNLAGGARVQLSESYLRVWDADTPTHRVWLNAQVNGPGLRLEDRREQPLERFSLAQLLDGKVYLSSEGGNGEVRFNAQDDDPDSAGRESPTMVLRVTPVPVQLSVRSNTGLRLLHQSSELITPANLSFVSNFPQMSIHYSIVDQPEFGVVECLKPARSRKVLRKQKKAQQAGNFVHQTQMDTDGGERFKLCSNFDQTDIDWLRVRYRHTTSTNRSRSDSFGFQVHSGDTSSIVHVFHIGFIPVSIRVFVQEQLVLNHTDQANLSRRNLQATAFPHKYFADQLVFHVVEAPKFGMLSRRVEETGRLRRIGVSSNFTQQHIDEKLIVYRLHSTQFSVLSDFFTFQLFTPATTSSELFRFEVTYLPGGNGGAIHLRNRTLIVAEGGTQQITNNSLWLETADESNFTFRLALAPPLNGRLLLLDDGHGTKTALEVGGTFTSEDILNKRLFYEHSGDESRADLVFLTAESSTRSSLTQQLSKSQYTGEENLRKVPIWLSISVIGENDHRPQLRTNVFSPPGQLLAESNAHEIHLLEHGERILHPSLFPWMDLDQLPDTEQRWPMAVAAARPAPLLAFYFAEAFRDFIICQRHAPEFPVKNFTERELRNGELMVRHLSTRLEAKMRYKVSDGKHSVFATVAFITNPKPFVRLSSPPKLHIGSLPRRYFPFSDDNARGDAFVAITNAQLSAETNCDVDPDELLVILRQTTSPVPSFWLLHQNGTLLETTNFQQKDITQHRLFLALRNFHHPVIASTQNFSIPLTISGTSSKSANASGFGTTPSDATPIVISDEVSITVEQLPPTTSPNLSTKSANWSNAIVFTFGWTHQNPLIVSKGSSAPIDANLLWVELLNVGSRTRRDWNISVKYSVVKQPRAGALVFYLQGNKGSIGSTDLKSQVPTDPVSILNGGTIGPVWGFNEWELASGAIHYIHSGGREDDNKSDTGADNNFLAEDSFAVTVSLSSATNPDDFLPPLGPFEIPIHVLRGDTDNQFYLLPAPALRVVVDGTAPPSTASLPLTDRMLRLSASANAPVIDLTTLEYRIVRKSSLGALFNRRTGQPISNAFTHSQLVAGHVAFLPERLPTMDPGLDALGDEVPVSVITLRACTTGENQAKCSRPAQLHIRLERANLQTPELIKNEPLIVRRSTQISAQTAIITGEHLRTVDPDTRPADLRYLVWQQTGGHLALLSNGHRVINGEASEATNGQVSGFTQANVYAKNVAFVVDPEFGETRRGFHFLINDGLHQSQPEWFTVIVAESNDSTRGDPDAVTLGRKLLEVNLRLRAAPGAAALIGSDLLKVSAEHTVFQIIRPPLHGRLTLQGVLKPVAWFTQDDLDHRRLFYRPQLDLGSWSQRDQFTFFITSSFDYKSTLFQSSAEKQRPVVSGDESEEQRFRILTSYAHLSASNLHTVVPHQPIRVSWNGSIPINVTHLNLTKLATFCSDDLFIDLYRPPIYGWLDRIGDSAFSSSNNGQSATNKNSSKSGEEFLTSDDLDYANDAEKFGPDTSEGMAPSTMMRWRNPLAADQLHSGRHLIYRHDIDTRSIRSSDRSNDISVAQIDATDEFTLTIYASREQYSNSKEVNRLRVTLRVQIEGRELPREGTIRWGLKVDHFRAELSMVSGGSLRLSAADFRASHSAKPPSEIIYRINQQPSNGVRVRLLNPAINDQHQIDGKLSPSAAMAKAVDQQFTQEQLDHGLVRLEHTPINDRDKFDVIGLSIGTSADSKYAHPHNRALVIRIEPLALRLFNHSDIAYEQGKTYVLLNRAHLGADSNADRSRIVYNITRRPSNGTFYWVEGEKEANSFTQNNVDDGDLLYAQLNMQAFQDSFEFVLSNDEMELLPKTSRIVVQSLVQPRTFFTESRTITQLGLVHLNASALEGSSPRFLVITPPAYGRLFLHPFPNESATFFTHSDVKAGRLFFHAYDLDQRALDSVELELRSDTVQPARFRWPIDIRPFGTVLHSSQLGHDATDDNRLDATVAADGRRNNTSVSSIQELLPKFVVPPPPDMNYHFPIVILIAVVVVVVGILLCRRKTLSSASEVDDAEDDAGINKDENKSSEAGSPKKAGRGLMRQQAHLTSESDDAAAIVTSDKNRVFDGRQKLLPRGPLRGSLKQHETPMIRELPDVSAIYGINGKVYDDEEILSPLYAESAEPSSSAYDFDVGPSHPQLLETVDEEDRSTQTISRKPTGAFALPSRSIQSSLLKARRASSPTRQIPTFALPRSSLVVSMSPRQPVQHRNEHQHLLATAAAAAAATRNNHQLQNSATRDIEDFEGATTTRADSRTMKDEANDDANEEFEEDDGMSPLKKNEFWV